MLRPMREADEVFAGELEPAGRPRPKSVSASRLRAACGNGFVAGLFPASVVFTIYYVANHETDLPWVQIGSILAVFAPITGISLALFIELLVLAFDRVASWWRPLVVLANPVVAGVLGGALAGVVPGAVGVTVFGSYRGPFVGTALIATANIAGAVLVAVPLARRARRARADAGDGESLAIAAATAIATLALCAAAAVVTPLLVDSSFDRIRGALEEDGPRVGAAAGALAGAVMGLYVGLVIALGRTLGRSGKRASWI
jgi:hypothetical protein